MVCQRILFIVDTPEGISRSLVAKVAALASGLGAEVEVFDAVFDPSVVESEKVQETIERRRAELETIVSLLREGCVHARATVRWSYPPRDGIFRQVRRYKPDLLVIRSRKHAKLARILFTYSDYKLIESAPCAVLVIKNDRPYANGRVIAAVDPALTHDKPAALDERIVGTGAAVAAALKLPLHIYHACSLWPQGEAFPKHLRDLPEAIIADLAGACQAKAEARSLQLARSVNVAERCVHVEVGNAVSLLPLFVEKSTGDLLVMGAVSRSRIRKALLGHTAEKVLEETDCDVLIVRLAGPVKEPASLNPAESG